MDKTVLEKLLARPDRGEEEWFATRILSAAGIDGKDALEEAWQYAAGRADHNRWEMAARILRHYCGTVGEKNPTIKAAAVKDTDEALETVRCMYVGTENGGPVLLARYPENRGSVFLVAAEDGLMHKFQLPITLHAYDPQAPEATGRIVVQQSVDALSGAIRRVRTWAGQEMYRG